MPRTSKAAIEKAKKQEQILNLRLAGASVRAIAEKTKIPKSTVQRWMAEAIEEIKGPPAELVVNMELDRLDQMQLGIWKAAITGDIKAIAAVLKIMERRARYLNLDAAVAPDTSAEAKQALDDLMDAIVNSVDDDPEDVLSAMAPGATPASVLGPDAVEEQS
ncbi:Uncharacterised protein [Mycobacteroides abscessus subsp. abscessus]|nr:Uncharacterised protein [Mycobacteroides abscessus subsp. abscessus]